MREEWQVGYNIAGTVVPAGLITVDWDTGEITGKLTRRPVMPPPARPHTPSIQWDENLTIISKILRI